MVYGILMERQTKMNSTVLRRCTVEKIQIKFDIVSYNIRKHVQLVQSLFTRDVSDCVKLIEFN